MEFVMAEKRISFNGFTLTEVLLAVVIVGVIAGMVLPVLTTKFYTYLYNNAYDRDVNEIREAVEGLNIAENQKTFFDTMMYVDAKPESYAETSGKFLKKYLRVAKYCGDSNGDCFAKSYSAYTIDKKKEVYTPTFDGACASLKNGASICITPQIDLTGIHGFIDLNGAKGPNILSKDLRQFFIDPKHRTVFDKETSDVIALDEDPIRPDESNELEPPPEPPIDETKNPCDKDPNSLECCMTRDKIPFGDKCCDYKEIQQTHKSCKPLTLQSSVAVSCSLISGNVPKQCWYYRCRVTLSGGTKFQLNIYSSSGSGNALDSPLCHTHIAQEIPLRFNGLYDTSSNFILSQGQYNDMSCSFIANNGNVYYSAPGGDRCYNHFEKYKP